MALNKCGDLTFVNVAPVLTTIPPQTINEGALLTFTANATDADLPANTLTYSLIGLLTQLRGLDLKNIDLRSFMALRPLIFQGSLSKTACSADLGGSTFALMAIFNGHHVPSLFDTAQRWQRTPLLERGGKSPREQ